MKQENKLELPQDARFAVEYARQETLRAITKQNRVFDEVMELLNIDETDSLALTTLAEAISNPSIEIESLVSFTAPGTVA